jgi:hypothetical protein
LIIGFLVCAAHRVTATTTGIPPTVIRAAAVSSPSGDMVRYRSSSTMSSTSPAARTTRSAAEVACAKAFVSAPSVTGASPSRMRPAHGARAK